MEWQAENAERRYFDVASLNLDIYVCESCRQEKKIRHFIIEKKSAPINHIKNYDWAILWGGGGAPLNLSVKIYNLKMLYDILISVLHN